MWHDNANLYNKQAIGENRPGFQKQWGTRQPGDEIPESAYLTHAEFKAISAKWQKKLADVS